MAGADRRVPVGTHFSGDLAKARSTLRENSLVALERQVDVLEWLRGNQSDGYFANYLSPRGTEPDWARRARARGIRETLKDILIESPAYYVSPDMTTMVEMAAESMGEHATEGLSPLDLLTESGFLFFDRPIKVLVAPDRYFEADRYVSIRAITWKAGPIGVPNHKTGDFDTQPGVSYYIYVENEAYRDQVFAEFRELALADVMTAKAQGLPIDLPEPWFVSIPPDIEEEYNLREVRRQSGPLTLWDHSGWAFGVPWATAAPEDIEEHTDPGRTPLAGTGHGSSITYDEDGRLLLLPQVSNVRKLLLATWKMLSQEIVHMGTERAGRPLRRRAGRVIPDPQDVIVVRLRREYDPAARYEAEHGEELEGSWYSHRFLVRGHWRRQPFGPGRQLSKIIWVPPFVKGPKDAPLVVKNRVYSLEQ